MGAEAVLGPLEYVWHGENDPAPAKVLAAHWPGVPNLGDIAAITAGSSDHGTWSDQAPIDFLCAGYPCQGESNIGLRRGEDDPRWRWPDVWAAIRALRPRLVFLENVRGHLNRSFPRVAADLSAIGYVFRWLCVRASDVGAAHQRERLFIVGWPEEEAAPWLRGTDALGLVDDLILLPTPRTSDANGMGRHDDGGLDLRTAVTLLPTPIARDATRGAGWGDQPGRPLSETVHRLLPTLRASDGDNKGGPNQRGSAGDLALSAAVQPGRWGAYAPAIARWEHVIGRSAPEPTIPGRNRRQLSPRFAEWLMGVPAGWVTDVLGKRTDALRVLGNGVVPQAAALALRQLLIEPVAVDFVQPELFDAFT
jgi:DNA (cytosine-5)-methyltransferase 1